MTELEQLIDTMSEEQRDTALRVLDAVSRPLRVREIETLLRMHGLSRSRAIKIASTVKNLNIIAVAGPEHG